MTLTICNKNNCLRIDGDMKFVESDKIIGMKEKEWRNLIESLKKE